MRMRWALEPCMAGVLHWDISRNSSPPHPQRLCGVLKFYLNEVTHCMPLIQSIPLIVCLLPTWCQSLDTELLSRCFRSCILWESFPVQEAQISADTMLEAAQRTQDDRLRVLGCHGRKRHNFRKYKSVRKMGGNITSSWHYDISRFENQKKLKMRFDGHVEGIFRNAREGPEKPFDARLCKSADALVAQHEITQQLASEVGSMSSGGSGLWCDFVLWQPDLFGNMSGHVKGSRSSEPLRRVGLWGEDVSMVLVASFSSQQNRSDTLYLQSAIVIIQLNKYSYTIYFVLCRIL